MYKNEYVMIKSPLRYPGGKTRSADIIVSYAPDSFKEYREPFVGGASVFLKIKEKYPKAKYWLNDIYEDLYAFLNQCRYNAKKLVESVRKIKETYTDGRKLFDDMKRSISGGEVVPVPPSKFWRAVYFFVINRISFSGTTLSGGYSQGAYEGRFTDSSIDSIIPFGNALKKRMKITNWDYERVVEKDGDDVFIYLDPPYYTAEKSGLYGKNGDLHKGFDHERFANVMKNCKHKWLITYDDCEYIRNLFSFAKIVPFEATYGMKNVSETPKQKGNKEVLIMNY